MKRQRLLLCLLLASLGMPAQTAADLQPAGGQYLGIQVQGGDTLLLVRLHDVHVFPQLVFKNKKQEKFYWRTVRDVKKTLPYAKMIVRDMEYADAQLALIQDKKERRKWWRKFEKQLFRKYEKDFRNMTASQGMMLMKLMDRETDRTSYELIKHYRSKASADFWQFVAKLFRNDLKEGYDGTDKDRIIERVITLVEAGQL
ncbi:MAG: DUF4294 domain-containing protein [Paludibacteraceae bacterium]|nr:DUF4294 domain-containing protein [Paludibacteraceae bacterium]